MNSKTLTLVGLLSLAAGIMAIICYNSIRSDGVTIVAGIFFVAVGIINLLAIGTRKDEKPGRRVMTQVANAGAIIFGICLLVFKAQLSPLVQWVFGITTALCAVWMLLIILFGLRPMRVPMWTLVFPLALAGCSVYTLLQNAPVRDDRIVLATGIALCVFGLGSLALAIIRSAARKALADKARDDEKQAQRELAHAEKQDKPQTESKTDKTENTYVSE